MKLKNIKQRLRNTIVTVGGWIGGLIVVALCVLALIKFGAYVYGASIVQDITAAAFSSLIVPELIPLLTNTQDLLVAFGISMAIFNFLIPKSAYKDGRNGFEKWAREKLGLADSRKRDDEIRANLNWQGRLKYNAKLVATGSLGILGGFCNMVLTLLPVRIFSRLLLMYLTGAVGTGLSMVHDLIATLSFCAIKLISRKVPGQLFKMGQEIGESCTKNGLDLAGSAASKMSEVTMLPNMAMTYMYGEAKPKSYFDRMPPIFCSSTKKKGSMFCRAV